MAGEWHALARAFLPDACQPLQQLRELLLRNGAARGEGAPLEQIAKRGKQIAALEQGLREQPPYTAGDRAALFADLQVRLRRLHASEVEACSALAAAVA